MYSVVAGRFMNIALVIENTLILIHCIFYEFIVFIVKYMYIAEINSLTDVTDRTELLSTDHWSTQILFNPIDFI